ncbi:MAG: hypothetical protein ACFHVJ_18375 [Aestuariibacter sp.]
MIRRNKPERPYRLHKSGLKEKFIDRQILAIHKAIVKKLLAHPELHQQVFDKIEARRESGKLRHGGYLTWYCLMENIQDKKMFAEGVLEDSPKMNKLRRSSPFVGILTEEERQQALQDDACGGTSIETLF